MNEETIRFSIVDILARRNPETPIEDILEQAKSIYTFVTTGE